MVSARAHAAHRVHSTSEKRNGTRGSTTLNEENETLRISKETQNTREHDDETSLLVPLGESERR